MELLPKDNIPTAEKTHLLLVFQLIGCLITNAIGQKNICFLWMASSSTRKIAEKASAENFTLESTKAGPWANLRLVHEPDKSNLKRAPSRGHFFSLCIYNEYTMGIRYQPYARPHAGSYGRCKENRVCAHVPHSSVWIHVINSHGREAHNGWTACYSGSLLAALSITVFGGPKREAILERNSERMQNIGN